MKILFNRMKNNLAMLFMIDDMRIIMMLLTM